MCTKHLLRYKNCLYIIVMDSPFICLSSVASQQCVLPRLHCRKVDHNVSQTNTSVAVVVVSGNAVNVWRIMYSQYNRLPVRIIHPIRIYTHNASATGRIIIHPIAIYTHNTFRCIHPMAIYTHELYTQSQYTPTMQSALSSRLLPLVCSAVLCFYSHKQ
jgi:hypothetical protein